VFRHAFHAAIAVTFALLTYAVATLASTLSAVREFRGICPALSADVPAQPCSVGQYADRVLFGGPSFPSHMLLLGGWLVAWLLTLLALKWFRRRRADRAPLLR
jgi:hypothetical protein